jgi:hypothetical protein
MCSTANSPLGTSSLAIPPEIVAATAGTSVRIEGHAPHNYVNESGKPARMPVLVEPSMTAFFREIGTIEPQSTPNFACIGAAMQRHGIESVQMVPWSFPITAPTANYVTDGRCAEFEGNSADRPCGYLILPDAFHMKGVRIH